MNTIYVQNLGEFIVKTNKGVGCGDTLIGTETINGNVYNLYMGYCGYMRFYAIKLENHI